MRADFSGEDIHSTSDSLMTCMLDGLVRHDRLLTDSLLGVQLGNDSVSGGFGTGGGPVVKTEHSYSMAGSDGDSIPDSPLSHHDTGKFAWAISSTENALHYLPTITDSFHIQ